MSEMRASHQEQTGTAGQNRAAADFEDLGWGPIPNYQHDLGTDLFLQVRDERRVQLGLMVGAQVKSGASFFTEVERDDGGQVQGWWFRDADGRHFDAWLQHSLPHLIVLHDPATRTSYWAHVTEDAVVSTGQGAKILVPRRQTVAREHLPALLEVAASRQPAVPWEGSIWLAGSSVPPAARLRYALLVPRLVAPHPNAGRPDRFGFEQATAMLVQTRLMELAQWAETGADVPAMDDAHESPEWGWRFAAALYSRITDGDHSQLLDVFEDAPDAPGRVAATVATASALIEDGEIEIALDLVERAIERDEADAVDHAWLHVQRARGRAEIGLLAEAREDAAGAQAARSAAPSDATASAIAGAAAVLLFNTSSWGERDVREVITGSDTAASWWLAQTSLQATWAIMDRSFTAWARDPSITIGGEDVAHARMLAAALASSHVADHGGWRHLCARLSEDHLLQLDRHGDPEDAARALTGLRMAGDDKSLVLAARHLTADGPADAVSLAAAQVELARSTRTTAKANLKLLEVAGDLLDGEVADRMADWLLTTLRDPSAFVDRTSPSYAVEHQLTETLAGVIGAAGEEMQRDVITRLLESDGIENQLLATSWARVLEALPQQAWREEDARRAGEVAGSHGYPLGLQLRWIAAPHDPKVQEALEADARAGSLDALGGLGTADRLPAELVRIQVASLAESMTRMVAEARRGHYGMGADVARTLTVLNLWHPEEARWTELLALLAEDAVMVNHKRGSLQVLAKEADRIPEQVRSELAPIAVRIARREAPAETMWDGRRDAAGEAATLAGALNAFGGDEAVEVLMELLEGQFGDRAWAAALAEESLDRTSSGLLAVLSTDRSPIVRAAAAAGLARMVAEGEGDATAQAALDRCMQDPGVDVPRSVAGVLRAADTDQGRQLLALLGDHRSAKVRRLAQSER